MGLGFGYNKGLPEGVKAAWGARLIVGQDGYTDYVPNRADRFGDEADLRKLFDWLDGDKAMDAARKNAESLLASYTMRTREAEEFVLYEDEKGVIRGNTNGSGGYLYVAGYLREAVPVKEWQSKLLAQAVSDDRERGTSERWT